MGFVQMKKFLLTSVMALAFAAPAYAKTCGTAGGTDAAKPGDAALFNIYDGSCSSDNQANDGDDVKAFLDKGGTATFNGPDIDFSLSKNTALVADQNTMFKDLSATSSANGFTDGNGFANIKSVGDALQSWEIDPHQRLALLPGGKIFNGFDGILFRGQFTDLGGGSAGHTDTGSFTISINLSDGSSITETFSGLKLKADDATCLASTRSAHCPSGLFVDSVSAQTDANHAWDQIKQVEFSIESAALRRASLNPRPGRWGLSASA